MTTPMIILAPMEGVTDFPMRALLSESGAFSLCVSEFLRVSQEVPPEHVFLRHIPELSKNSRTPSGIPVQCQLLGGDPDRLARSAVVAAELGAQGIDLNFGCPAPTVNRHDGGATLLKFPLRLRSIVEAVRKAVPAHIPVSAKVRLGWDDPKAVHENCQMAAEGGAAWITIHGRTRMQGYAPPADWVSIGEVRKRLPIPIVANGDIWSVEDFKRCRDITGCDRFMVGRGVLANPRLAVEIARELGLSSQESFADDIARPTTWIPMLKRFSFWCHGFFEGPLYVPRRMKQWLRLAHTRGTIGWFDLIKRCETEEDLFATLAVI